MRLKLAWASLLLVPLAVPAASADIQECSTPDPRNVYDYCIESTTVVQGLIRFVPDVDTAQPVCFPVPVLDTICPPVVDPSSGLVALDGVTARLTLLSASTQVHANYVYHTACALVGLNCGAQIVEPSVSHTLPIALADRNMDGIHDGIGVRTEFGFCYQNACTVGPTWFYFGR